jgi:hypothetical protein
MVFGERLLPRARPMLMAVVTFLVPVIRSF